MDGGWLAPFFFDLENKSGHNDEPHMAASDLHALITGHHEPNVRLVPHASNPNPTTYVVTSYWSTFEVVSKIQSQWYRMHMGS